jgi:hypothetical protein
MGRHSKVKAAEPQSETASSGNDDETSRGLALTIRAVNAKLEEGSATPADMQAQASAARALTARQSEKRKAVAAASKEAKSLDEDRVLRWADSLSDDDWENFVEEVNERRSGKSILS